MMDWVWILAIAAGAFIALKLFLKTLKLISLLAIVAIIVGLFWMLQHGMLPFK